MRNEIMYSLIRSLIGRNEARIATHDTSAAESAIARALRAGAMATAIAPTSGRKVTIVRIGRAFTSGPAGQDEERAGHHEQTEGDPQGVVLDAPGLDAAEPATGADRALGEVVDR